MSRGVHDHYAQTNATHLLRVEFGLMPDMQPSDPKRAVDSIGRVAAELGSTPEERYRELGRLTRQILTGPVKADIQDIETFLEDNR